MQNQDILQQLSLQNTQIQTPFGTKLIVTASTLGGAYDEIESIIQNTFKPIMSDLSDELEKQIFEYSEQSILNYLKANNLKLIVGGHNINEAYQTIQVQEDTLVLLQKPINLNNMHEWIAKGCTIDKINKNPDQFKILLEQKYKNQKSIILSFKFNEGLKNSYKTYVQIAKEDKNRQVQTFMECESNFFDQDKIFEQFSLIDFFIFTTQNMLGGQESLSFILARDLNFKYQFKQKNLLGLYRSALVLEFQQSQFFDQKKQKQQQIENQFIAAIEKTNENLKQIEAGNIEITKINNQFIIQIILKNNNQIQQDESNEDKNKNGKQKETQKDQQKEIKLNDLKLDQSQELNIQNEINKNLNDKQPIKQEQNPNNYQNEHIEDKNNKDILQKDSKLQPNKIQNIKYSDDNEQEIDEQLEDKKQDISKRQENINLISQELSDQDIKENLLSSQKQSNKLTQQKKQNFMNPNHIQKVLLEVFGIQTTSVNVSSTKQGFKVYSTLKEFNDLQSSVIEFQEICAPDHLKIQLFFHMSATEIQYIASALERIVTYQSEIYLMYQTRVNQYKQTEIYHQYPERQLFSLQNLKNLRINKINQNQRDEILLKQLQLSSTYFQNPKDYLKFSQGQLSINDQRIPMGTQQVIAINFLLLKEQDIIESQSVVMPNNSKKYLAGDQSVVQQLINKQQQKNSKQKLSSLESALVNSNSQNLLPQNKQVLPSQIFSNNMYSLQRRQHNLKQIFEFYGEKVGDKEDNYLITVSQMWKFVQDFKFTELIQISDINEFVRQVAFCIRGVFFWEFQQVLEKIAKKIYLKHDNLPTQYDKTEAFYLNVIGIDLKENFKQILQQKQFEKDVAQQRMLIQKNAEEPKYIIKTQSQEVKKGYQQIHQLQEENTKRLNLKNVDWNNIEKVSATDFSKGIGEKSFKPGDLVDLNDQDLYLLQYDISNDLKMKKIKQQDREKQISDYGNYQERQRPPPQKLKTDIGDTKKIQPESQKNRIKQVEAKESQREKNLLEFLNTPAQNRKKI